MASIPHLDVETTSYLLKDAVRNRVASSLKELLMKEAEKEIDKIVSEQLEKFKVDLESYYEPYFMRQSIQVLVKKEGF